MFITKPRSPSVLLDLIQRTKDAVRELDKIIGSKFKKLLVDADNLENNEEAMVFD